jgi:hypothetical protein
MRAWRTSQANLLARWLALDLFLGWVFVTAFSRARAVDQTLCIDSAAFRRWI